MNHPLIGAAFFLILALGVAYGNYRLLKGALTKSTNRILLIFLLRELINLLFLAAVFFLAPYTPWSRFVLLISAVVGLTVGLFGFTFSLIKKIPSQDQGGDNNNG